MVYFSLSWFYRNAPESTPSEIIVSSHSLKDDPTAERVFHPRGAAFAEEDSLAHHANACFAMPPSWFVFRVLYTLGVSAVRSCSEVEDHYFVLPAHQIASPHYMYAGQTYARNY